jgi:hypothetical protein
MTLAELGQYALRVFVVASLLVLIVAIRNRLIERRLWRNAQKRHAEIRSGKPAPNMASQFLQIFSLKRTFRRRNRYVGYGWLALSAYFFIANGEPLALAAMGIGAVILWVNSP